MRNSSQRRRLAFRLALLAVFACLPLSVSAQNVGQPWSTIASAGEADDASQSLVDYSASFASIKSTAPSQSVVVLRYNVVPVDGIFYSSGSGVCKMLRVRFRDDGDGARVVVTLKRTTISNGATVNMLTFDSNSFAPSANYQTQVSLCTNNVFFDFKQNSYWIEATLSRFPVETVVGKPGLQIIQIAEGTL